MMNTSTVIPTIIPNRNNPVWDTVGFVLTLGIGVIALVSYMENRKTNKMQRELIELNLKKARQEMGITEPQKT